MEAIEKYKAHKELGKILDFFEEKCPTINFLMNYELFQEIIIQVILDFQINGKNKNFKYYPWLEKIKEKKKEMYGF